MDSSPNINFALWVACMCSVQVPKFLFVLLCTKLIIIGCSNLVLPKTNLDLSHLKDILEVNQSSDHLNPVPTNPICNESDNLDKLTRVCSMGSVAGDYGNLRGQSRVLVFRLNGEHVKLFIEAHHISLPNATVSLNSAKRQTVHFYHDSFSGDLFTFYAGSLVVADLFAPFTAQWDGSEFSGSAVHLNHHLDLQCAHVRFADFYTRDGCFSCWVSCSELDFMEGNTTIPDYLDLFTVHLRNNDVPEEKERNSRPAPRNKRKAEMEFPAPLSCSLHLVADHLFFSYVGYNSMTRTLNTMLGLINDVDAIFRPVDFDGDGYGDNIGFIVGKVDIFSSDDDGFKLRKDYMSAEEYLRLFSASFDFSEVCLGVAFTFRNLGGVSGIAFPAYSDPNLAGGICQERVDLNSHIASFNSLVVTMYSNGGRLPREIVVLNLAHELGHSFGARHDDLAECVSEGPYGHFIMYQESNPGTEPNNRKFSACSLRSILPVIMKKGSCLLKNTITPQCGNTIPEDGEECDCGVKKTCLFVDPCCTPSDEKDGLDAPCKLRRSEGKLCSPRKGSCCMTNCTYIPASQKHTCNTKDGCSHNSVCDGRSGHCPSSDPQPDGTFCNFGMDVCKGGYCSVGICEYYNMTACFCTSDKDRCKLCCKDGDVCLPVGNYSMVNTNSTIQHDTGVPCYDNGYCSSAHMCTLPLKSSLATDELFGPDSEKHIKYHFNNYWFYYFLVALCFLILIIFLTISYKTNDSDFLKALRYGKILAVFAIGEHQSKIYRKILLDINNYYNIHLQRVLNQSDSLAYHEAVARIKVLFPQVSTRYTSRLVKLCASESMAVKLLLIQGHKMRTFTEEWVEPQRSSKAVIT